MMFDAESLTKPWADLLYGVGGSGLWDQTFSFTGVLAPAVGDSLIFNTRPQTLHIAVVHASVGGPPTGAPIVLDLLKNGVSIYTTTANRPTIPIGVQAVFATLPDDVVLDPGDHLTASVISVGSTFAGRGLTLQVLAAAV